MFRTSKHMFKHMGSLYNFVHAIIADVSSNVGLHCCIQKTVSLESSAASDSYNIYVPLPQWCLSIGNKRCGIDVSFRAEQPPYFETWILRIQKSSPHTYTASNHWQSHLSRLIKYRNNNTQTVVLMGPFEFIFLVNFKGNCPEASHLYLP